MGGGGEGDGGLLFHFILSKIVALHLGDIAKSRCTRGTREETLKREGGGPFLGLSPLTRPNKRACSQASFVFVPNALR